MIQAGLLRKRNLWKLSLGVVIGLLVVPSAFGLAGRNGFEEDFSSYGGTGCMDDGSAIGPWTTLFNSYGCTEIRRHHKDAYLRLVSEPPDASEDTRAALVLGPALDGDFTFQADFRTEKQLRKKAPANSWEVAWLIWNYSDNDHFYYFIPKKDGWELGKRDPSYKGNQRFLETGTQGFDTRKWHNFRVEQQGNAMALFVDDAPVISFTDTERPYAGGQIGFYSEDADAWFGNVKLDGSVSAEAFPAPSERPEVRRKSGIEGLLGNRALRFRRRMADKIGHREDADLPAGNIHVDSERKPQAMSFSLYRYHPREFRRGPFRRLKDDPGE